MATIPNPPIKYPIVDPKTGIPTKEFVDWMIRLYNRVGSASGGLAPFDATYITQTANSELSGEQALSLLSTGMVSVATGSGVLSSKTITGTADKVTVTNGTGSGGDPTITIAATYPGQTSITTLGTVATGTWVASSIATTYTDAKLKTLTGTSNRITIGGTATDPTVDLSTSYAGQATITTLGTIATGTWNGSSISTTYTDAKLQTLTGTANRITIGGTSTDPTVDISASYVGQATITTLGTIATGTWGATTIAVDKGGTGQTSYTDGQLLIGNTTGNTLNKATLTGTSNQVTVTNGSGSIILSTPQDIATGSSPTFAALSLSTQPSFLAYVGTNLTDVTGDGTSYDVIFNTEVFDRGSGYNTSTGIFTAPSAGTYVFGGQLDINQLGTHNELQIVIITSNRNYQMYYLTPVNIIRGGNTQLSFATLADMDSSDTAKVRLFIAGSTKTVDVLATSSKFYGWKVG